MADYIPRMNWTNNDLPGGLKLFKQTRELYFLVKEIKKEKQVDHILLFMGEAGLKMYNAF